MKSNSRSCVRKFERGAGFLLLGWLCCLSSLVTAQQVPAAPSSPASQDANSAAQTASQADQGPESLHIVTGRSLVVRTQARIKRLLTGDPTVIESVLTSPYEVVLTAKHTGGSSVVLWEEDGQSRLMEVSADLDVSSLRNTIEETYPDIPVDVQSREGKVVLVGTVPSDAVAEQITKMAGNFSKEVVNGFRSRGRHARSR